MTKEKKWVNTAVVCLCLFGFHCFLPAQTSSVEMERLFSSTDIKAHNSYSLQHSNTNSCYYWVARDTLYSCASSFGAKIALIDIDFSQKSIVKDNMLVQNTRDNVYVLSIKPSAGKTVYSYNCYMSKITGPSKPNSNRSVNLDMDNSSIANDAFLYLQKLSENARKNSNTKIPDSKTETQEMGKHEPEKNVEPQKPVSKESPDFMAKELWDVYKGVSKLITTHDNKVIEHWNLFVKEPTRDSYDNVKFYADLALSQYSMYSLKITNLLISPSENKLLNPLKEYITACRIYLSAISASAYQIGKGADQNQMESLNKDISEKGLVLKKKQVLLNDEAKLFKVRNGLQ